ncbi:MAG: hypothetical protein R2771_02575 [Saprospiraceae bacterium]
MTVLSLYSCGGNSGHGKKLAKIYGNTLYSSDVDLSQWSNLTSKDSVNIKTLFIEHWIKEQLLLHDFDISSKEKKSVENLVSDYRNSLILDIAKKKIISENIDTVIDENEYQKFYDSIKSDFKAKESMVNYILLIIDSKNENIEQIKKLWNNSDYNALNSISLNNNELRALGDTNWKSISELKKQIPESLISDADKYSVSKSIENQYFFLKVESTVRKNEYLPLKMIEGQIKEMIINKRKANIIDNYILDIYKKESDNIKIYD